MATIAETGSDVAGRSCTIYEGVDGLVHIAALFGVTRSDGRAEQERRGDALLLAAVTAGVLTTAQATAYKTLTLALYQWLKTQTVP